ncbi:MAG: hypothetical protein V8R91_04145 [Butyricimonas faecihominis]
MQWEMRAKGKDTTEIQLTTDGEHYYSFNREDEGEMDGRLVVLRIGLKRDTGFTLFETMPVR